MSFWIYSIITAHIHPQKNSAPEFSKGNVEIIFQPSWSRSRLTILGVYSRCWTWLEHKARGFCQAAPERHLQTTVTEDISQKARVQISLIKMGKARVSEVRGAWLKGEERGMKGRKRRRKSNKYFTSVFKHCLSNTQCENATWWIIFWVESDS